MKTEKRSFVTIETVGNGYIVRPSTANQYSTECVKSILVFETFTNLSAWLKKSLEDPNAVEQK